MSNETLEGGFQVVAVSNHLTVGRMGQTPRCPDAGISRTFSPRIELAESKGRGV